MAKTPKNSDDPYIPDTAIVIKEEGLTPTQIASLPYFLTARDTEDACAEAGISVFTYYDWMTQPAFKQEIFRLREQIVEDAIDTLRSAMVDAVVTLVDTMHDSKSEKNRMQAANDIIKHFATFKEVKDLENKIDKLERIIMGKEAPPHTVIEAPIEIDSKIPHPLQEEPSRKPDVESHDASSNGESLHDPQHPMSQEEKPAIP